MDDRSIRVSGGSGLFYFTVLCSYANFRTSYLNLDGIHYTIRPGEWICRTADLSDWFRARFQHQALAIMEKLQNSHLITYTRLGGGRIIKFKITDWHRHNTVLDYNAPCQKDAGFFFMPIQTAAELISAGRCSEADIILDLWMNTVYNDLQVQGSDVGPVVYFRNGTGMPLIGYSELAARWGLSKSTVGRVLKKFTEQDYLSTLSFAGRHGSIIYLNSYLSTMFQISDVMIDKDEIAMALNLKISFTGLERDIPLSDKQFIVSKELTCVPKSHMRAIISKVAEILVAQGVRCCECHKSIYKLSPLSGCRESYLDLPITGDFDNPLRFTLILSCGDKDAYLFELNLQSIENQALREE